MIDRTPQTIGLALYAKACLRRAVSRNDPQYLESAVTRLHRVLLGEPSASTTYTQRVRNVQRFIESQLILAN